MEKTKAGWKTTEFWITVALGIAGVVLLALGKDTLGTALLAGAGFSYSASRGLTKLGAARRVSAFLLAACLLFTPGCTGIRPEAIEGLADKISTRHDAYVHSDTTLSVSERATYLLSTKLLRAVIEESKKASD